MQSSRFWRRRLDDDWVDRLSRHYSIAFIACLVLLSYGKQLFGRPMACWVPAQFTDSHREYSDMICWSSERLYSPARNNIIPPGESDLWPNTEYHMIWIRLLPILWIIQGVCCSFPGDIWKLFYRRSQIDLDSLVDTLRSRQDNQSKGDTILGVAGQINRFIEYKKYGNRINCLEQIRSVFVPKQNQIVTKYLSVKLLYLLNAFLQLAFLNDLMAGESNASQILGLQCWPTNLWAKDNDTTLNVFSRAVMCNFEMQHQSRLHNYVVQCAMPINVIHEYASVCLWVWFVFVANVALVSLIQWTFCTLYWPGHTSYVSEHIWAIERRPGNPTSVDRLESFTKDYLGRDGMFVIHIIGTNVSHVVAGNVLWELWTNWIEENTDKPTNPLKPDTCI